MSAAGDGGAISNKSGDVTVSDISAPVVRLMMYPDGARLGVERIAASVENALGKLSEVVNDVDAVRLHRRGELRDRREIVDGIRWILKTGAPWRDLPEEFGPYYLRWRREAIARGEVASGIGTKFAPKPTPVA